MERESVSSRCRGLDGCGGAVELMAAPWISDVIYTRTGCWLRLCKKVACQGGAGKALLSTSSSSSPMST
jgi:hypothetical protein